MPLFVDTFNIFAPLKFQIPIFLHKSACIVRKTMFSSSKLLAESVTNTFCWCWTIGHGFQACSLRNPIRKLVHIWYGITKFGTMGLRQMNTSFFQVQPSKLSRWKPFSNRIFPKWYAQITPKLDCPPSFDCLFTWKKNVNLNVLSTFSKSIKNVFKHKRVHIARLLLKIEIRQMLCCAQFEFYELFQVPSNFNFTRGFSDHLHCRNSKPMSVDEILYFAALSRCVIGILVRFSDVVCYMQYS